MPHLFQFSPHMACGFSLYFLYCFSYIALCNILVPLTLFLVKYLHYPVY